MMHGFPQVEDLTQDEIDDSDVMCDRPQAGEVSEVGSITCQFRRFGGLGSHEPGLPERPDTPDGPEGSDLECSVPELVMDVSGWNMSAGTIGLMTGDVMIACSQEDAHLLGE